MPSPQTTWTGAILLLVLIWTVYFLRQDGVFRAQPAISETNIKVDIAPDGAPNAVHPPSTEPPAAIEVLTEVEEIEVAKEAHTDRNEADDTYEEDETVQSLKAAATKTLSKHQSTAQPQPKSFSSAAPPPAKANTSEIFHSKYADKAERPLILYAYAQTDVAETNLRFFVGHGLHNLADFIFIINGESPQALDIIPDRPNIRIIERENDCYDLGAYAEVLTSSGPDGREVVNGKGTELWKKHHRFILMNASIRGPFMPTWANGCWMDAYLGKVTDRVKLVGMTANCSPRFHVQSMIWATDSVGIDLLLHPPQPKTPPKDYEWPGKDKGVPFVEVGINDCFHDRSAAVHTEVFATQIIRDAGFAVDVMMAAYHKYEGEADEPGERSEPKGTASSLKGREKYINSCDSGGNGDVLWNGHYFGTNVHPYETIFLKTNRDIDPVLMEQLTAWVEGSGYSSYDHCKA